MDQKSEILMKHFSVDRHRLSPELQEIYQQYYINKPKDFIELLGLIKEKDLKCVIDAIWNEIFKDPVMIDAMIERLTRKSYIVNMNGDSYKIKETKEWMESNS